MFTVVEVLALRVTNYILVVEVMLLGKWNSDKKIYSAFLQPVCLFECNILQGKRGRERKRESLVLYFILVISTQRRRPVGGWVIPLLGSLQVNNSYI